MLNLQNLKGIFLDLDDTFYSYPPCNEAGKQAVFAHLASILQKPAEVIAQAFESGRQHTKDMLKTPEFELAASHSRLLYCQNATEELIGRTNAALTLECEKIFWSAFIKAMNLFPGARECLTRAKTAGKIIAIVTDMTAQTQLQKLVALGIADLVDFVISSEEAGREKPDPSSMHLALQKTRLKSHEVVMVGEDEARDTTAARAAGIVPIAIHQKPADPGVIFANNFDALTKILAI